MKALEKDSLKLTTPEEPKKIAIKKAKYCTDSVKMATVAIRNISDPFALVTGEFNNGPDIDLLHDEITKQIAEVSGGNTNKIEIMLMAQAKTLDILFNAMINRSLEAKNIESVRYHMDIALKAQGQGRKTLLALDAIKNPPQKQIVGQQNIALNQQVNNSNLPDGIFKSKPKK